MPAGSEQGLPSWATWGVWGGDDEVGTVNRQTPERVLAATALVRYGIVVPLNWRVDLPDPPLLGRGASRHIVTEDELGTSDDRVEPFYPQRSSQWDALAHVRHPRFGSYNGWSAKRSARRPLAIDRIAARGIAGRFVLADVAAARERAGRPIDCGRTEAVTGEEIDEVLESQGAAVTEGDVLLIRFGWTGWYEALEPAARSAFGAGQFPAPGLAAGAGTAEWIAARRFSAVASDTPALEVMPIDLTEEGFLHYRLIPLLGLTVGELFDLERLSRETGRLGAWEGLIVAAPWRQPGGVGSPANAVALL